MRYLLFLKKQQKLKLSSAALSVALYELNVFNLRNRSAPAVNCWVIIHCLEVICKEDQTTSAQRE